MTCNHDITVPVNPTIEELNWELLFVSVDERCEACNEYLGRFTEKYTR